MLKIFFIAALLANLCLHAATAQVINALPCGATEAMEELAKNDPDYARHLKQLQTQNEAISANTALRGKQQSAYVIPVVVHIMHEYNLNSNISKAQVLDAMRILNEDFNKLASDSAIIIPAFRPIHANSQIEFRLAQLDPNGNCTDGITRTYTPQTNSAGDLIKNVIRWDPTRYLNVWVVRGIASGAGGYSYLPCVSSNIDGIVIRNGQFGSIGTSSPFSLPRSLTHEVGHYLGLPHTWGFSNTPGLSSNCTSDDGIADTPNTIGVTGFGCNTSASTCGNLNNVQNIMDYSGCQIMFTLGQKAVMHNTLQLSCRNNLWSPANLNSTGTSDGFIASACPPNADFNANLKRICSGASVTFSDFSYASSGSPASFTRQWFFTGGTPATSTATNPTITYNTSGLHAVTLVVSNAAGPDTITKAGYIQVIAANSGVQAPLAESFEDQLFPQDPADANKNWELESTTTSTWERTTSAAFHGGASMRIRHNVVPSERLNSIITPNLDLSNVTQATLSFAVAYAESSSGSLQDRLKVYYSVNCGQTWQVFFNKAGSVLATAPAVNQFVPANSDQWRVETENLPNVPRIMLKFESISGQRNTLYLDAINISGNLVGQNEQTSINLFQILPNPSNGHTTVKYYLQKPGPVLLQIYDMLGRQITSVYSNKNSGEQEILLNETNGNLSPGVYLVSLKTDDGFKIEKLVIN